MSCLMDLGVSMSKKECVMEETCVMRAKKVLSVSPQHQVRYSWKCRTVAR